jgi:hypothetical protein
MFKQYRLIYGSVLGGGKINISNLWETQFEIKEEKLTYLFFIL